MAKISHADLYPAHKEKGNCIFSPRYNRCLFFVSSESPITLFCVQNTALQTPKRQPTFSTRLDFNFSSVIHLLSDRKQLCFQIRVYLIDFVIFFSKQRASLSIRNMNSHVNFCIFFHFMHRYFISIFSTSAFYVRLLFFKLKSNK